MYKYLLLCVVCVGCAYGQTNYLNGNITIEGAINYCGTDTGTGNAYVCANPTNATIAAYKVGALYSFKASHANTASATLAIDGKTATTIKKQQGASNLASGDIASGAVVVVQYDGTNFEMQSTLGNVGGGGATAPSAGMVKSNGSVLQAATADTDYQSAVVKSVKSFGAVGDGSTNDASAIQSCIDSIASTGGACYFPPTSSGYNIGTTTITQPNANVALVAPGGKGSAPLLYSGTGDALKVGSYGSGVAVENIRIENMSVHLTNTTTGGATGIHVVQSKDFALLDNAVETSNNGATNINGQTCYWLDGGNTGVSSDFGSALSAWGNDCRLGATWIGVRISAADVTNTNAFTAIDWMGGRLVSGTTAHTSAAQTVCGATNASPIVITLCAAAPTYAWGSTADNNRNWPVVVASVGGNTNANSYWVGKFTDATHVSLVGSSGNAAYTSGGTLALSSTGVFVETGSEIRLTADIEQWNQGINTDANYVGCMSPRFELNDTDWINGIWDRSCLITPHLSGTSVIIDRGTNTTRLNGTTSRIPNIQATNGLYWTGDTGGGNARMSIGQFANGSADTAISYISAKTLALGSNTQGDASGTLQLASIDGSTTATVAAGTGAGTSPTISVAGSALAGTVSLTTGTSPAVGTIATVSFGITLGAAPNCVVASNAKAVTGLGWTTSTTQLVITDTTALTASTSGYKFAYVCMQ